MFQDDCTMVIYLPFPDFALGKYPITDVSGYGLFGNLRQYNF